MYIYSSHSLKKILAASIHQLSLTPAIDLIGLEMGISRQKNKWFLYHMEALLRACNRSH